MKPVIIHFIQDLRRGGAETMLVSILKELEEYRNIVVTIGTSNDFEDELVCEEHISLNLRPSISNIPYSSFLFRKVLKKYEADLVHSHLPFPNFIARLATPAKIPLISTIHTFISNDYKKYLLKLIDKVTYKYKSSTVVGCSKGVLNDYLTTLKIKKRSNSLVIYNPIQVELFKAKVNFEVSNNFRLVTIATLKQEKNLFFLVDALSKMKDKNIELHIFGDGYLRNELELAIEKTGAPVKLYGLVKDIKDLLYQYDLFVMASLWEGFSISVLEAMASAVPMLLSNIESFKEQAQACAYYFELSDTSDFINKVTMLKNNHEIRNNLALAGYKRVCDNFTMRRHLNALTRLYNLKLGIKKHT